MVEYLAEDWLLKVSLVVAVDVLVADGAECTLALYPLAVLLRLMLSLKVLLPLRMLLPLRVLTVAVALSIVRASEVAVEVARPQVDITEVVLDPKGKGLLHTGALSLLVQFCKQPQSARGGSGLQSVQRVWVKETVFQFLEG